ncbi:MAG: TIGR03087 family PEP-CTERM/XrtA system glycosyltransferase [Burkholderiales bacterium]|nr:TIGR03087 family PEP-CTERM/XrtA system glycosyltransferase [Burkholderiales bacterium]
MANILFLPHRLPWPPTKGDKVRTYHLLRYLAERHRVYLGTFVDDPDDVRHVDAVRAVCAEACILRLRPRLARIASLRGLFNGEPLSLPYYRSARMTRWIRATLGRVKIDAALTYSSSMAQYVPLLRPRPVLQVFDDVDSAKWTEYAAHHRWPMAWLYAREGRQLLAFERAAAMGAARTFFQTAKEVEFFRSLAPECSALIDFIPNGVDADYFDPAHECSSPYSGGGPVIAFTGAMDYWPNVDAVQWFTREILPRLRELHPDLRFWIVGRSPTTSVRALASSHVHVTGTVPDVRPYLKHATLIVAPLRLARGLQNKILEAMAMGKAVIAARSCADAIEVEQNRDLASVASADDYVATATRLLASPETAARMGAFARSAVLARYSWSANLAKFGACLAENGVTA